MPLFIDRLPFHTWIDPTRTPALPYWTIVLPMIVTEPTLTTAPPVAQIQDWVFDTGNRGEAFAWRHHLIQAGLDQIVRLPQQMTIRTVTESNRADPRRRFAARQQFDVCSRSLSNHIASWVAIS